MGKIIIIGGGAAGMMAAVTAGERQEVLLLEKNDRLGKKLFITGKGRCNLTNACEEDRFFRSVVTNSKFMYSAFYAFDNQSTIEFFEKAGLLTKVERGDRVFPASDHSSDVIGIFKTLINRNPNIQVLQNTTVTDILCKDRRVIGVCLKDGRRLYADAVIVATGGVSYPLTGSTGDGYTFAKGLGHTVIAPLPSLVPFELKDDFCKELMGLSLKNVVLSVRSGKKRIFDEQGEMLFTHFGISGPLVLRASAYIHPYLNQEITMYIDLKPALDEQMLDDRLLRDFEKYRNKDFRNALSDLLPVKLISIIVKRSGIDPFKKVNSITRQERIHLINCIKKFEIQFHALRGFDEAIITKGGVCVKEINPSTMESRLVKGLFFAGEVMDVDALTGGFNLQIAWSTGRLAGLSCIEKEDNMEEQTNEYSN